MKKLLLSLVGALGLVLIPATASAAPAYTDVSGVIYYNGVHVGKGVKVTVKCDGNTLTDKTNKTGTYLVQFTKAQCPKGSMVTVSATYNGVHGTSKGKAMKATDELNVAIVNVSLPEMGLVTGIGATMLGGGAFFLIRRRSLGANA
jgi:hypothetical protein